MGDESVAPFTASLPAAQCGIQRRSQPPQQIDSRYQVVTEYPSLKIHSVGGGVLPERCQAGSLDHSESRLAIFAATPNRGARRRSFPSSPQGVC